MSVKFLSADYMEAATTALADDPVFQAKIENTELSLQFDVGDTPSGEPIGYYLQVSGGTAGMQLGVRDAPDVTIKSSFDTATSISRGHLNVQMALMAGKIKVDGSMAVLMLNQTVLMQWGQALADLDIEY